MIDKIKLWLLATGLTNIGYAAGAIAAMGIGMLRHKHANVGLTLNGCLAGLVGITAGCASVDPWAAIVIGVLSGIVMLFAVDLFDNKLKIDDPVGAISVHGVNGAWGTLAAGIFNIGGTSVKIIGVQLLGIAACFLWVFPVAFIMFKLIDKTVGLRVSAEEELTGLDYTEHGGNAYPDFEVLSYGGSGSSMGEPGPNRTNGEPVGQLKPVKQT